MANSREPRTAPVSGRTLVDEATLRRWIANCDPQKPIDPSDERYFDLDRVTVDGEVVSLRGDDHIEGLYDGVTLGDGESCQLFSGFSELADRMAADGKGRARE